MADRRYETLVLIHPDQGDAGSKELAARIGKLIEDYYGKAYDIEFGIDEDMPFPENVVILQVRPESVWSKKEAAPKTEKKKDAMDRIVSQLLTGVRLR